MGNWIESLSESPAVQEKPKILVKYLVSCSSMVPLSPIPFIGKRYTNHFVLRVEINPFCLKGTHKILLYQEGTQLNLASMILLNLILGQECTPNSLALRVNRITFAWRIQTKNPLWKSCLLHNVYWWSPFIFRANLKLINGIYKFLLYIISLHKIYMKPF